MARVEVERRVFERSFMCAPIYGRSGPVGAHPEKTGHCSNAGGLSAVVIAPLYSNRRIRGLAAHDVAGAYTGRLTTAFLSPAAISASSPHQSTSLERPVKEVGSVPSSPSAHVIPTICPACRSSSIVTKAKSPDSDSYWRCMNCGEIWNVSRCQTDRHGARRWQ
jgi:predicted Zn finger-like uncharacterized protein